MLDHTGVTYMKIPYKRITYSDIYLYTDERRQKMKRIIPFLAFLLCFSVISPLHADIPHIINFQGRIADTLGEPITGTRSITFRIYDAESGGSLLWNETHANVTVRDGIFSVLIGSVSAVNLSFDGQYYLGVQVGGDPEMTPRQRIASVGYAYKAEEAENADTLDGMTASITPAPNTILPLNANAQIPASVVPSPIRIKAWVNFDGTTSSPDIRDSYNVTSVTRNGNGDYTVIWDTDFANTNYVVVGNADSPNKMVTFSNYAVGSVGVQVFHDGGGSENSSIVNIIAIGN